MALSYELETVRLRYVAGDLFLYDAVTALFVDKEREDAGCGMELVMDAIGMALGSEVVRVSDKPIVTGASFDN